ncbi:MAG: Gfo/Idh/MocA family oxidoreductase, partial [Candidatus Hydrogenedentes bacterium]|nr:Gfo/Idh/MocA family oxidoreductase [Candidatus Hydrogenedentota bacterium]
NPHAHASYAALAADPDVDVIYIATPHMFHKDNAVLCLEAGKHVLCEKAFTINAREAKVVIEAARREKRFLMEAMYTRHLPLMHEVRKWLRDGAVGEIRLVQANRCSSGTYPPQGRHMNLALGGGSLLDVGIYVLSFASMVLGEPDTVSGHAHLGPTGADEQASMALKYQSGALASLNCALHTDNTDDARILGTAGAIYIDAPFWGASRATLVRPGRPEIVCERPIENNGLNYEAAETMRCIRQGLTESPIMPLDESLSLMAVMDTLRAQWRLKYPGE